MDRIYYISDSENCNYTITKNKPLAYADLQCFSNLNPDNARFKKILKSRDRLTDLKISESGKDVAVSFGLFVNKNGNYEIAFTKQVHTTRDYNFNTCDETYLANAIKIAYIKSHFSIKLGSHLDRAKFKTEKQYGKALDNLIIENFKNYYTYAMMANNVCKEIPYGDLLVEYLNMVVKWYYHYANKETVVEAPLIKELKEKIYDRR